MSKLKNHDMKFSHLSLCLLFTQLLYSQQNNGSFDTNKFQYGASLKINLAVNNIGLKEHLSKANEPRISVRVSGNVGVAKSWITSNIYPALNAEFQLYNSGFGSNSRPATNGEKRKISLDGILALTVTHGFDKNSGSFVQMVPLRYFSDFTFPSLKNPYRYSASLGANLIVSTDKNKQSQRIGFLNLNGAGFQLSYYNDGTPFDSFYLGDGEDRYYTGGGTLSYDFAIKDAHSNNTMANLEISYHKFTGYNKSAFELSSIIGNSLVDYGEDEDQIFYNKSLWRVNSSIRQNNMGIGLTYTQNNSAKYDGQSWIHLLISDDSFHFVPYKYRSHSLDATYFIFTQKFK